MEISMITDIRDVSRAAEISALNHSRLKAELAFLPSREARHFQPRIEWIFNKGSIFGAFDQGKMIAFLGGFVIDDFRNAGPGAFCPDWCHGAQDPRGYGSNFRSYRDLYRALAPLFIERGARIHAIGVYVSEPEALEAFSLTGFGRIVMDAARPTAELLAEFGKMRSELPPGIMVRRAEASDAVALFDLNARLARHIGASPVLMPNTHGPCAEEWGEWFSEPNAVVFLAEREGRAIAYIKAQDPQFDVSFSVHDENVLGINGMYTDEEFRGRGLGHALLSRLADFAAEKGKTIVSVDCETTNPEAFGFWTRYFKPFSWSLERRV